MIARRTQVRRNVQAFRQRKRSPTKSNESHEERHEDITFVIEDWGQQDSGENTQNASGSKRNRQVEALQPNVDERHKQNGFLKSRKKWKQKTEADESTQFLYSLACLPWEINGARVSRQQFVSNVAKPFTQQTAVSSGLHWAQTIPVMVNRNEILDLCIQAICLMQISHIDHQSWVKHRSLMNYDRAVKKLQKILARRTGKFQDMIFISVMALAAFELFQGKNSNGLSWIYHVQGAASYLCSCSPLDDDPFLWDQISFHFLESVCVFDALGARKPSTLSKSDWWRKSIDHHNDEIYGAMLRLISSLPVLLEQCDNAMRLSPSTESFDTWSRLVGWNLGLESAFLNWFQTTLKKVPGFGYTESATSILTNVLGSGSETEISFPNMYIARLYFYFWECMVLLYDATVGLLRNMDDYIDNDSAELHTVVGSANEKDNLDFYTEQSDAYARKIAKSANWCLDPAQGIIGKSVIMLPTWIANVHFQENNDMQAERCLRTLDQIGQRHLVFGIRIG